MRTEELHKQAESQRLEFKESFGKDTVETVAAFCNASGGAILVGVDKKGKIKGVTVTDEILKEWVNVIKQATQPQIFPEISPAVVDGKTIVSIVVQEYPVKPVSVKGKYYKRVGASNHLIPVNEIVEMQLYSINSSFDSFTVRQTLADLQMELIVKFFRQLENTGRISLHDDPVVNLRKIGLLNDDQLTFAALLLFGEHQTGIHIGRFKTPDVIIDDMLIKSPLVVAVDEAMTFIKKGISLRYEFTGELRERKSGSTRFL
jgi:ATP-dependent DNA helicase RecG